jgi:hypothetical protein
MEQMDLMGLIEEHASFGFTGKINLLEADSGRQLGRVWLNEGQVVHASYNGLSGIKALFSVLLDERRAPPPAYIVEPEIPASVPTTIKLTTDELASAMQRFLSVYAESLRLRPMSHLRLSIDPAFIVGGDPVSSEEFNLLCTLSDYNLVSDIYRETEVPDHEVTASLVALRRKKAVRVLKI